MKKLPLVGVILTGVAFFSTMPGVGCYEIFLISADNWYSSRYAHPFDPLVYGGGPAHLIVTSLCLWLILFGFWLARGKNIHYLVNYTPAIPLMAGKAFDLLFEGRSWTGSYWAFGSAAIIALILIFTRPDRHRTSRRVIDAELNQDEKIP